MGAVCSADPDKDLDDEFDLDNAAADDISSTEISVRLTE